MKEASFVLQESYQDSMLALKEFMDMLEKTGKSKILDFEKAYMTENALSSVNKAEIDAWDKWVFDKMIKEIKNLENEHATFEDISDSVMLKHGLERNREIPMRLETLNCYLQKKAAVQMAWIASLHLMKFPIHLQSYYKMLKNHTTRTKNYWKKVRKLNMWLLNL